MKPHRLALVAALLGGSLLAAPGEFPLSSAYIAPANQIFYRLRHENGLYREFQRDIETPQLMLGAGGWKGFFEGGHIVIQAPGKANGEVPPTWVFLNGRVTRFIAPGVTNDIPYNAARKAPEGVAPPYFFGTRQEAAAVGARKAKKDAKNITKNLFKNKWDGKERLTWPFANPNENGFLFAGLAILAFALLLNGERPIKALIRPGTAALVVVVVVKVVGAVLFAGFSGLMFLTFSRGAFLAAFVGCIAVAGFGFRSFKRKATLIAVAVTAGVMLAGAAGVVCHRGVDNMKKVLFRGFNGKSSWSNQVRYDMWKAAPRMMLDAPYGWEGVNVGRAYLDWYEQVDILTAPGSLMNDHLTRMTRYGWRGRSVYAFSWLALLAALAMWGARKGNGAPFGAVLAFGVAAWFNPVMPNPYLWSVPVLSLLVVAADAWRWRGKATVYCLSAASLFGAVGTGVAAWSIYVKGEGARAEVRKARPDVSVRVDRTGAVLVKNLKNPSIWVLDDGNTLGGIFTCKEIRSTYMRGKSIPGIAYARRVDQLPEKGVKRLVLGGEVGDEWLKKVAKDENARKNLPPEVVFISPPFPPSAIPTALLDECNVKYVTGEFNARHYPEITGPNAQPPPWVEVERGMELYIMGWMRYAIGRW